MSRLTIVKTPVGSTKLGTELAKSIREQKPPALGIAVAYVSVYGATFIRNLAAACAIKKIRIIADTRDAITHPAALEIALDNGWSVRAAHLSRGTFHPKYIVGGRDFSEDGELLDPSVLVVGSGNLSKGGLVNNTEASIIRISTGATQAGTIFRDLWGEGADFAATELTSYEFYFAARNKRRAPEDIAALGVADEPFAHGSPTPTSRTAVQTNESMPVRAASAAWAGLESFTGDYTLQVEFPRNAGIVLQRIVGASSSKDYANIRCEDGSFRSMRYHYYSDNSMFRLNVPNDVPGVAWVRGHKAGVALVDQSEMGDLSFRIVMPGLELDSIVRRSVALGTLGRTPTRLYGWY